MTRLQLLSTWLCGMWWTEKAHLPPSLGSPPRPIRQLILGLRGLHIEIGRYGAAHQPDGRSHESAAAIPIPGEPDTALAGGSAVAPRSWCPASFSPLAVALVTSPPRPRRSPWLGRAPPCTPSSCPRAACHGLVAPEGAPSAPRATGVRRAPASDTAHGRPLLRRRVEFGENQGCSGTLVGPTVGLVCGTVSSELRRQ